jgi:superfamily II RNA helicase
LGIKDEETIAKHEAILRREKELKDLEHRINNFKVNFARYEEKQKLEKEVDALDNAYSEVQCSDAEEIQKNIFNLLGPFNYYDDAKENLNDVAEFAINLPVKENILLAELFFNKFFDDKSSRETLLILSTFIEMEVTLERMNLTPTDKKLFEDFTNNSVQKFAQILRKKKIIEHVLTYMKNFNASLFDFLDVWCKRLPFNAAIRHTDIRSGFVATYLERLHELLVSIIARVHLLPPHPEDGIDWYKRFNELDTLLTRDIPFTTI